MGQIVLDFSVISFLSVIVLLQGIVKQFVVSVLKNFLTWFFKNYVEVGSAWVYIGSLEFPVVVVKASLSL